jgi:hypothetical protein
VGLLILLCQIDFGDFLMVVVRSVVLANFIPTATFTTMVIRTVESPTTSIKLLFPDILVLVLLLMLIGYYNSCAYAHSLGIAAQFKIIEEHSLVFIGLWFGIYFWPLSEKYKIM